MAIPLSWLLLVNVALWTGLVEWAVSREGAQATVHLRHGWAWCAWPTRIHVRDLSLTVLGPDWQLDVTLPRAAVDVSAHELLARRWRAEQVQAQDAAVVLSLSPPHEPEGIGRRAVHGHREALRRPTGDAEPKPADEAWQIVLEDVDVELRRLEIDAVQAELQAHLGGALDLTLGHRVSVPSATLQVSNATFRLHDEVIAEAEAGHVDVVLYEHDPRHQPGPAWPSMLSAAVSMEARVPSLAWVDAQGWDLPLSIRRGGGWLSCDVTVHDGVLLPGSTLRYRAPELRLVHASPERDGEDLGLRGALDLEATVHDDAHEPTTPHVGVRAELTAIEGHAEDRAQPWMSAGRLVATVGLSSADLAQAPWSVSSAKAELPSFQVSDLGVLGRVGSRLELHGGHLGGNASARTGDRPGVVRFDFASDVKALDVSLGESTRLRTDGYVRSEGTLDREAATLSLEPLHAKLRELSLTTERGRTRNDWLEIHRATLEYQLDAEQLDLAARGRLDDLRPLLVHLRPGDDLLQRVPDLDLLAEPVDYDLRVSWAPAWLLVDVDRLVRRPLEATAMIAKAGSSLRAAAYFRHVHVGVTATRGDGRTVELAVDPSWYREQQRWVRALRGGPSGQ